MLLDKLGQKGFTLIEILVAVGISAGLALLAAKLISDQSLNQNFLRISSDIDKRHAVIQSSIKNTTVCNDTFSGIILPSTSTAEINIPKIFKSSTSSGTGAEVVIAFPSTPGTQDYVIESMILRNPIAGSTYYDMRESVKELVVTYEMKRKYFGDVQVQKPINIFMTMDPGTGAFRECGSVLADTKADSQKKMCDALGAVNAEWVEFSDYATAYPWLSAGEISTMQTTYPNGKCKVKDLRCPIGEAAIKLDSLGGLVCHPVSSRLGDLSGKIDTAPKDCVGANTFQIMEVGGKFTIVCSVPPVGGCSTACDCPGMMDVCLAGTCVNQASSCTSGEYAKGDSSCRFLCSGGMWVCPAPGPMTPPVCGGGH